VGKGWDFKLIARGKFALYSPEGVCTVIEGDPAIIYEHGPNKQIVHTCYGYFRRAVERIELDDGLTMIVITVGENRRTGNGFADELLFLSESSVFAVYNLYANDGQAHAYRRSAPYFYFEDLKARLGSELAREKTAWLYFNGEHLVQDDGTFPRSTQAQQGVPKRALRAEELDGNPGANEFVLANPAFSRRLGISTDDLRFVSLWRQAQAAASDDSNRGVQQRAREYIAKAQEEVKDRIVVLEKLILEQNESSEVTLAAKIK
jgi:hypothetical protein